MPLISENKETWGASDSWLQHGDEWSESWGSPRAQWLGSLFPRVFPFLKGRILEIAPGHGRWTQFLRPYCTSLIGIDLAQDCVDRCIERFRDYPEMEFSANDGMTFPMVESASIDFAFSFDSLVHAEADVMASYTRELKRVLKPGGVAFLHHSNLNAVLATSALVPASVILKLRRSPVLPTHWRAKSMSAAKMRNFVKDAGMTCVQQEIVPWLRWPWLIDCMSTLVNAPGGACKVITNPRFMVEAAAIKRISTLSGPEPTA